MPVRASRWPPRPAQKNGPGERWFARSSRGLQKPAGAIQHRGPPARVAGRGHSKPNHRSRVYAMTLPIEELEMNAVSGMPFVREGLGHGCADLDPHHRRRKSRIAPIWPLRWLVRMIPTRKPIVKFEDQESSLPRDAASAAERGRRTRGGRLPGCGRSSGSPHTPARCHLRA